MSEFLKKLKGLFVEEVPMDQGSTATPPSTETKSREIPTKSNVPNQSVPQTQPSSPAKTYKGNESFDEILYQAMEKANQSGFDYLEFKQSLKSLQNMGMTDEVKYKSAFAMAQTMGVQKQPLLDSAAHYIQVLGNEESAFSKALQKQINEQIDLKKTQIQAEQNNSDQKLKTIAELTKEIELHKVEIEKLTKQMAEVSSKIENTKGQFNSAYQQLVGQIQADIEKMKLYLA